MKVDQSLIQQCDSDIRNGQPLKVGERLAKLNASKVDRKWRLPLAKVCRRAGLHSIGLALLTPLAQGKGRQSATPSELAEYAVLLLRHGAISEAASLLQKLDSREAPEVLLYQSYALFLDWRFEQSIPLLEQYMGTPLDPYAHLVGQTNLAFALTESRRHKDAIQLTDEILRTTHESGNRGLQGTCHALRAQVWVQERDFPAAREEIRMGGKLHASAPSNDHFLLTKWGLILEGLDLKSTRPFDRLRLLARQANDWEACREADMFSLLVNYSEELFVHLYFGSPLAGLRERIRTELGAVPKRTTYVLGTKGSPRFDLRTGQLDGKTVLNPGKKEHQLLQVLLTDFYRPLRIGGLFSQLFPEEHFNIVSSPQRVHQIIRRTRLFLKNLNVPVEIDEANEYYSFKLSGPFSIRVPLDTSRADAIRTQFERVKANFGEFPFSIQELRKKLEISEATAHRLIKWATRQGYLTQSGRRNRSLLFVCSSNPKPIQQ